MRTTRTETSVLTNLNLVSSFKAKEKQIAHGTPGRCLNQTHRHGRVLPGKGVHQWDKQHGRRCLRKIEKSWSFFGMHGRFSHLFIVIDHKMKLQIRKKQKLRLSVNICICYSKTYVSDGLSHHLSPHLELSG